MKLTYHIVSLLIYLNVRILIKYIIDLLALINGFFCLCPEKNHVTQFATAKNYRKCRSTKRISKLTVPLYVL